MTADVAEEQRWLNPYELEDPVFEDGQFFGRVLQVDTILRSVEIDGPSKILVAGPRRIGKSSLLLRAKKQLSVSHPVTYVDLRDLCSQHSDAGRGELGRIILGDIIQQLEERLQERLELKRRLMDNTPAGFREHILPQIQAGYHDYRLVVLLDEIEVLQDYDRRAAADVLSALTPNTPRAIPPLVVVSQGRTWSQTSGEAAGSLLRGADLIEMRLFERGEAATALTAPVDDLFQYSEEAIGEVLRLANGQPFFISAIGWAVFESRRGARRTDAVTVDEIESIMERALRRAAGGLEWAGGQINLEEDLLVHGFAKLGAQGDDASYVDVSDVVDMVRTDAGYEFQVAPGSMLLDALVANFVLDKDPAREAYRIHSPFLQRRLREDSFGSIQFRQTQREPKALDHFKRGQAAVASAAIDQALQHFSEALRLNPDLWQAELEAAKLESAFDLPQAVARLQALHRQRPGNTLIEQALIATLTTAAYQAWRDEQSAEAALRWLDEVRQIDPGLRHASQAEKLLVDIEIGRWRRQLDSINPSEWRNLTRAVIRSAAGPEAWRRAAATYCDMVRDARPGEAAMSLAIGLAREVFPQLIRDVPLLGDDEETAADAVLRDELWALTVPLLRGALSRIWDPPSDRVPAALLEELLFLPMSSRSRSEIRSLAKELLPRRFRATLREDPADAPAVVRLLQGEPEIGEIRDALAEEIVACDPKDPAASPALLRIAPTIYGLLIDNDRALPEAQRLRLTREYLDQIELLLQIVIDLQKESNVELMHAFDEQWLGVFSALDRADSGRAAAIRAMFPERQPSAQAFVEDHLAESGEVEILQRLLGAGYRIGAAVPYAIAGVPPDNVRMYRGSRGEEPVDIRVYSLMSATRSEEAFLRWLWDNEYRALYNLATRWEGRALAGLHFAAFDWASQRLVLVTDHIGSETLRELLDRGRIGAYSEGRRGDLWRHLHALVDAVAALHRFGYLHRGIRPENIIVDRHFESSPRAWLRLTNFEWSVYVYALARAHYADGRRRADYYVPPEALALELGVPLPDGTVAGEGFSTDIYALGLVLFECLVRLLKPEELRSFEQPDTYDVSRHMAWAKGLQEEVRNRRKEKLLSSDEAGVIIRMIEPSAHRRAANLEEIAGIARRLSLLRSDLTQRLQARPLIGFTTLDPQHPDCISEYLKNEIALPDDLLSKDDSDGFVRRQKEDKLAKFIEEELRGAYVYVSTSPDDKPLLLQGNRVSFTAKPFRFDDRTYRRVAFIEVAKRGISAAGDWLTRLGTVRIRPIRSHVPLAEVFSEGESWDELFRFAETRTDGLGVEQRRMFDKVQLSVELEKRLWLRSVYECEVLEVKEDQDEQTVRVRELRSDSPSAGTRLALADAIVQSFDREVTEFDLSRSPDPTAPFHEEARWYFASPEEDGDVVFKRQRRRLTPAPPAKGDRRFVRPWSLAASRALYQRRQGILSQIRDDTYLLRSITEPQQVDHFASARVDVDFIDRNLDENKQELVRRIVRHRPLFLVQGPPGTGKTTLAREVVLQTLEQNPSARILITSQAHEPLNNLLDKTEEALEERRRTSRGMKAHPLSVRLLPAERLDVSHHGETGTRIGRQYHPSNVARLQLERAAAWRPPPNASDSIDDPAIIHDWQSFLNEQVQLGLSAALEERIVRGANLVYATANDRRVAEFREDSFDLVIFEEAARAYPIELLAPMRLARRWLLIGDQKQLPPFGIEDFDAELVHFIDELQASRGMIGGRQGPLTDAPAFLGFDSAEQLHEEMSRTVRFFDHLHTLGRRTPHPISSELQYQWRMHPDIGNMLGSVFYPNVLKTAEPETLRKARRHRLETPDYLRNKALLWIDVPPASEDDLAGEERGAGGGYANGYEARALMGFLKLVTGPRLETAIITPYRAQVLLINRLLVSWNHPVTGPLADRSFTVDSFQGRQAGLVALSLVRNNNHTTPRTAIGFLENESRSTVMFSRAERLLVVIGSSRHFKRSRSISRIYELIAKHGEVRQAYEFLRPEEYDAIRKQSTRRRLTRSST